MDRKHSNDYELLYMIYQMDEVSLQILVMKYRGLIKQRIHSYYWGVNISPCFDDILSDSLELLYASIYAYRDDQSATFFTYFYCVLENNFATIYRNYQRDRIACKGNLIELDYMIEDTNLHHSDHVMNQDITLEGIYYLHLSDYQMKLNRVLRKLRPQERAIVLERIKGYSYEEIAKKFCVDVKKVDNTLSKVRNRRDKYSNRLTSENQ